MAIPDYLKDGPNLGDEAAAALAALAQDGDREARERMTRCHIRLATRMVNSTHTRLLDPDERFQVALITVDHCTMQYRAATGVPFRIYAGNQIRLRIMKAIEKERRAQAEKDPQPNTERQDRIMELRAEGLDYRQVAEEMGLTVDVVESEGKRINEAFAADALSPNLFHRHGTQGMRRRGKPVGLQRGQVYHGTEGEDSDLDRLIRRAQADGRITEKQVQAIRLRADGLSLPEIGRALGIKRTSAGIRVRKARKVLKEMMLDAD